MANVASARPPQPSLPQQLPREREVTEPTPSPYDPNEPDWAAIADAATD